MKRALALAKELPPQRSRRGDVRIEIRHNPDFNEAYILLKVGDMSDLESIYMVVKNSLNLPRAAFALWYVAFKLVPDYVFLRPATAIREFICIAGSGIVEDFIDPEELSLECHWDGKVPLTHMATHDHLQKTAEKADRWWAEQDCGAKQSDRIYEWVDNFAVDALYAACL